MRQLLSSVLLFATIGGHKVLAQTVDSVPQPHGSLLSLGTDSLAIYLVRGNDTTRTGIVVDELRPIEENGQALLQRVYTSTDWILGSRVDTLVDVRATLAPVRHRSRTTRSFEFLDFTPRGLKGWLRLANGDSIGVAVPLPATVYNSSSFDLVLRSSPLRDGWSAVVPVLLPSTRTVVPLRARVAGSEVIGGEATWRVEAEFTGMPVTFWISKTSRKLKQQTMQVRPDVLILFATPKRENQDTRAS